MICNAFAIHLHFTIDFTIKIHVDGSKFCTGAFIGLKFSMCAWCNLLLWFLYSYNVFEKCPTVVLLFPSPAPSRVLAPYPHHPLSPPKITCIHKIVDPLPIFNYV
jgi:hypothetical protein